MDRGISPSGNQSVRVLVVDDFEAVRRGICSILSNDPSLTVCGEAVDGMDALEKATALRPDVIVMDVSMPNMNGLDATRAIKRVLPEVDIVIVSQHGAPEMARQALSAGAREYVTKSNAGSELLAAVTRLKYPQTFVKTGDQTNSKHGKTLDMPRWILTCPDCSQEFTHSQIAVAGALDISSWLGEKPDFPESGISLECPGCGKSSLYQRNQLLYRTV